MIIHWTPCGDNKAARWSQPSPDVLRCEWRGKTYEVDFSDAGVEYIIPEEARDVVHGAWRETDTGPLHLKCPSLCNGLSQDVTIDHGSNHVLGCYTTPSESIAPWEPEEDVE